MIKSNIDSLEIIYDIKHSAKQAVLYRKYLNDEAALKRSYDRKMKAIGIAKDVMSLANYFVKTFSKKQQ